MNGPLQVLVDGRPSSEGWPLDRGLQYGDGLFETMSVREGGIRFEAFHRERLAEGCRRLGIDADLPGIWDVARATARAHGDCLVKLLVTRGDAVARGYTPAGSEQPRAILSVFAPPQPGELPATVRVVSLDCRLGENPDLAGLKHCNRLEQVLARRTLQATGAFEGLMGSSSGPLISGTMSNVFLELNGELVTPGLERCGVAGVMRAVVLREAQRCGAPVRVAGVTCTDVAGCTGMALSNARLGLLQVHELDGRRLPGSGRLAALAEAVAQINA